MKELLILTLWVVFLHFMYREEPVAVEDESAPMLRDVLDVIDTGGDVRDLSEQIRRVVDA